MERFRVLYVDDDPLARRATLMRLEDGGYEAVAAASASEALTLLAEQGLDAVVTDLRMPGIDGLELLRRIRSAFPDVGVVVVTAYGSVDTAVEAMRLGAVDYLTKPFSFQELDARLTRLRQMQAMRRELDMARRLLGREEAPWGIVGGCPAIRRVRERIALFASSPAPVLVVGETGTGKELVARALHAAGPRRAGPFVALGCAAVPAELAESELFGHERGAFTGAVRQHRGVFERAHGGTLLLDDVDDLPLPLQAKLLRALEEHAIVRVGGQHDVRVDVRVVATTKVDLSDAVAQGRLRADLLYRLRGLEVRLPPLRDRGEDILLLASHFLAQQRGGGVAGPRLSAEAARKLMAYPWPGNVRELRRAMEAAAVLCDADVVTPAHLPGWLHGPSAAEDSAAAHRRPLFTLHLEDVAHLSLPALVREFEQAIIAHALERTGGNQKRAAEWLGVPRTTLQSKLRSG